MKTDYFSLLYMILMYNKNSIPFACAVSISDFISNIKNYLSERFYKYTGE